MKLVAPDYYEKFTCIANECKHNCCIGWEIDIDETTLSYYSTVEGELGERMKQCISNEGDAPHFALGENDRCPFLNENNLCDIIASLGEDALCDICADHPRFRNYFSDRTEIGLGLCCESAGKLILKNQEKVSLVTMEDDGEEEEIYEDEAYIAELRDRIFSAVQDREKTIDERVELILNLCGAKRKKRALAEWTDIFLSMERLDESWTELLNELKNEDENTLKLSDEKRWEIVFEQLLHYFIYRHLPAALDDGMLKERIVFAGESSLFIRLICAFHEKRKGELSIDDIVEYSRMYSSEMEYSEENVEKYLNFC